MTTWGTRPGQGPRNTLVGSGVSSFRSSVIEAGASPPLFLKIEREDGAAGDMHILESIVAAFLLPSSWRLMR
jgi:hypothetical protein